MDTRTEASYAASWTTEGMSGVKIVTEAEWLNCTDPTRMLEFLRGKASERKLRLFTVGCSRFVWEQITDEGWREAIQKAEL